MRVCGKHFRREDYICKLNLLIYQKLLGHDDFPLITKHLYTRDQYLIFTTLLRLRQHITRIVKLTIYFRKQYTNINRVEREYDLSTVAPPTVAEITNSTNSSKISS
jgi:hypothetical protein